MKKGLTAFAAALVFTCAPVFGLASPAISSDEMAVIEARKLLQSINARDVAQSLLTQIEKQMYISGTLAEASVIAARVDLTADQKAIEIQKANARIEASKARVRAAFSDPAVSDELIEELAPLYAETYTLDEIRQLIAFYATPLGQKMAKSESALMTRSMEISRWVVRTHLPVTR